MCVCVWGGGGGVVVSEFSVAWGKRGEGGQGREGVQNTLWVGLIQVLFFCHVLDYSCEPSQRLK